MLSEIKANLSQLFKTLSQSTWQKLALYFGVYLLPVLVFVAIADEVRDQDTLVFDDAILRAVHTTASHTYDQLAVAATNLGGPWAVGCMMLLGLGGLLYYKKYRDALILLLGVGGAVAINTILKLFFQRDRPQLWQRIVNEQSFSFPSGHAMASAALAATIIIICWPTRWRWAALVGGILYVLVIGLTRLYLGVHYPTDIIAGWTVSVAWVLVVGAVIRHWHIHLR